MFLAFGYQPGFGPLAVAYAAANIASAIPLTPGGLGVVEVTLVAISVGFGSPQAIAVLAVLGYRVVNYWLPLLPGAVAYLRLRLTRGKTIQPNGRALRHSNGQSGTRTGADLMAAIALANASKGVITFPCTAIRSGLRGDDREVRRWQV